MVTIAELKKRIKEWQHKRSTRILDIVCDDKIIQECDWAITNLNKQIIKRKNNNVK